LRNLVGVFALGCLGALVVLAPAGAATSNPWRLSPTPGPRAAGSDIGDRLYGVAADSPTDAWAVGNNGLNSLILHWNGVKWATSLSGNPEVSGGDLLSVAALTPNNVWAAGEVLEHWNGSTWTRSPLPTRGGRVMTGLSGHAGTGVWGVDYEGNLYRLTETGWKQVYAAPASLSSSGNPGVVAFSPTNVWVEANTKKSNDEQIPQVLHWDGTRMHVHALPTTTGDFGAGPDAIGGTSGSDVWVVGSRIAHTPLSEPEPYAAHWNGSKWSLRQTPPHLGVTHELFGVAANSPSEVWAVGDRTGARSQNDDLLEDEWTGSGWTEWGGPNPESLRVNDLRAVASVPGTSQAWAVGSYLLANGKSHTLIVHCCE